MTVFENSFQIINYLEEIDTVEQQFLVQGEQLYGDNYKNEVQVLVNACEKYHPKKLLINNSTSDHIISDDLQSWIHDELNPKIAALGIKWKAYVLSPEIFSQLSIELTAEKNDKYGIVYTFFGDRASALEWLSTCSEE